MLDVFHDFIWSNSKLFIVIIAATFCLVMTPINFKIITPIEDFFKIPEYEYKNKEECTDFYVHLPVSGIEIGSCYETNEIMKIKTRPSTFTAMYLVEIAIGLFSGYLIHKLLLKLLK